MNERDEAINENASKSPRPPKVAPEDACPGCGERNPDRLEWMNDEDGQVRCAGCGFVYACPAHPGNPGDDAPANQHSDPQLDPLLDAALGLLLARKDQMATIDEWAALARAAAARTGGSAAELLTERDLEQAAEHGMNLDA